MGPFNTQYEIVWRQQWQLVSWQNMVITAILMLITLERASRKGYSPVGLISKKADSIFIEVLKKWRSQLLPKAQ